MALNVGPVALTISAHNPVFKNYKEGIISSPDCGNDPKHAVVAVGYGVDKKSN